MSSKTISETGAQGRSRDRAEPADYAWLVGDEAAGWLAKISSHEQPLHAWVAQLRAVLSPARTHLLLELVELRRRARQKFDLAERMFFTRVGLEQATDQWIAAYKARRFAGCGEVADLCCGVGGDLVGLARHSRIRGIDIDPVACLLAQANSRAILGAEDESVELETADCRDVSLIDVDAWHMDPDRRPYGRRTTSLEHCQPDRAAIERLLAQVPNAAIKLAPATRVPPSWESQCELEWISRDRECRQLVAWRGDLATDPGQRRATVIQSVGGISDAIRSTTIVGHPSTPIPVAEDLDGFIIEPDPAVLAAGLAGVVAEIHKLKTVASGVSYLTGSAAIDEDLVQCFAVREVLPYQLKPLRDYVRRHDIGQLEVKKRGVRVDPEQLRKQLRLDGNGRATLIVTRLADRTVAIFGERFRT